MCHDIAVPVGQRICTTCRDKIKSITGRICYKCSKPLAHGEQEYCENCRQTDHFDQGIGIFTYAVQFFGESLFQLKYGNRQEYGVFYGQLAAYYSKNQIRCWNPQIIIPIPLHKKENGKTWSTIQAEIIAFCSWERTWTQHRTKTLLRTVYPYLQKDLGYRERKKNLEHAFERRGNSPGRTFFWSMIS